MFADWPDEKSVLADALNKELRSRMRAHAPTISQFAVQTIDEGDRLVTSDWSGYSVETAFTELEVSTEAPREQIQREGAQYLGGLLDELAQAAASSMERDFFTRAEELHSSSGGLFKGSASESFVEQFLLALDKMDISFDEDGKPGIFIVMHPDNYDMVMAEVAEADKDGEIQRRVDLAIEKKRDEWTRRETRRRVVD